MAYDTVRMIDYEDGVSVIGWLFKIMDPDRPSQSSVLIVILAYICNILSFSSVTIQVRVEGSYKNKGFYSLFVVSGE